MEQGHAQDKQAEKINQIKEILFGSNIEEIENRFSTLETRIANEANNMLNTFRSDLEKLRNFSEEKFNIMMHMLEDHQNQISVLREEFENEINEIKEKLRLHKKELEDVNTEFNKKTDNLDKKAEKLKELKLDTSRFVLLIESVLKKVQNS